MASATVSGVQRWARDHPWVLDGALGAALAVPGILGPLHGLGDLPARPVNAGDIGVMTVVWFAVSARRRWPVHMLLAGVAAAVIALAIGAAQPALVASVGILAFTMASRSSRRTAWVLAGGVAVSMYLADAFVSAGSGWSPQSFGLVAWVGMATAFGDATRSRRAYVVEVEERARRAEQTREEEASRRVIQERLRIARELHDVVAHHIAVINMQAGAASHVLRHQPDNARRALAHIHDACDTVLGELASIVGVLRQADDAESTTEPVRGLTRLPDVVDALAAAGLTVERRQFGQTRELPAVTDLAAYRIVQEALTNAHKYGTGTADLTVTYTAEGITIDIVNAIDARRAPTRSGYGIVGMRERAVIAGGTLCAEAGPDGRFTVHADLPTPTPKAAT